MTPKDPVLTILREIRDKQDLTIQKQEHLEQRLDQIHGDCRKAARTNGAVAGGVAGALTSATIAYLRAKLGL